MVRVTDNQTVLCLMGPTAAGKTDVAIALSKLQQIRIISVDSVMIYRDMNIGSAKPSAETLAAYPHDLVDIRDAAESYSVADFCQDASECIKHAWKDGVLPVLAGGTMMYFHALQNGLATLPGSDPDVRVQLQKRLEAGEREALYADLLAIDPDTIIHKNDTQRLLRALELHAITGQVPSQLQAERESNFTADFINIALVPQSREQLHERIEKRLNDMWQQGFLHEVEKLYARNDLNETFPAIRAVGYRQVWQHLQGEYSEAEMQARALFATRQLAKRQLTWLKRFENKSEFTVTPETVEPVAKAINLLLTDRH